ncbi:MAG: hypothetical protein GXZ05_06395 [Gammaproteobacteria bacterium]|jgi:hypothetical protein|nr:hypothetical protein [Gammaproteobacteria bacterium]
MPQVHLNTMGVEVQFCRSKKLPCRLQIAAMATKALRSLQTFSSSTIYVPVEKKGCGLEDRA